METLLRYRLDMIIGMKRITRTVTMKASLHREQAGKVMEVCQHCGMYMKPFKHWIDETHAEMSCEFCGEVIARAEIGQKWVKILNDNK